MKIFLFWLVSFLFPITVFSQQLKLILPLGHLQPLTLARFSGDGKRIITVSIDKTAKIWDVATGCFLTELHGKGFYIWHAEFSPDGKKAITAGDDKIVTIWEVTTGNVLFTLKGHTGSVNSACFDAQGEKIVTASADHSVKIWDAASGRLIMDLAGHTDIVNYAHFSRDGKKIISVSKDGTGKIWDATTGNLIITLAGHNGPVIYSELSADGKKIVTASYDSTARVWNATTGKQLFLYKGHRAIVTSVHFDFAGEKIVTTSRDKTAIIWSAVSGKKLFTLEAPATMLTASFSPDNKKIVTSCDASEAAVWNAATGSLITNLTGHKKSVNYAEFSTDGKRIVTASSDKSAKIWDAASGSITADMKGHSFPFRVAQFSPDGEKIITLSNDSSARLWDVRTTLTQADLREHTGIVKSATFSDDSKMVITMSDDSVFKSWDAGSGKFLGDIKDQKPFIWGVHLSPDNKKLAVLDGDSIASVFSMEGFKKLTTFKGHRKWINAIRFSPDGLKVVTASWDGTARIWNAVTGELLKILEGHTNYVNTAQFSPDGKKILTASDDNTCKLWDAETGNILYTFFVVDSGYFTHLPSGYYSCSPDAAKLLHYITQDLRVISFEQLDIKFNRPDKILHVAGHTDTALVKSYYKAWEKRIKKLGIDTTAFRDGYSVPEADFTNRDVIEHEQKSGTLKLLIKGNDSTYKLDRFNVWVNETPIFGQRGINIRKRNKNDFDTTITINLSHGENRIETSITDVNGTESYRMPLIVNYSPAVKQKESVRFIGIGIDQFLDNKNNLQYSAKDIRDLATKLKEKYKEAIIIDTLFNENVTTSNVKALRQKLLQTTENDKVIVAYSGHGMLSKEYDYFLSTYSVNFNKPEENGLPYDELENLLDSIPARKKLMLIDACHSGEVDKEDLITLDASSDSLIKGLKPVAYKKEGHLGLKNSFELMQSLFVNVGKSTGANIISAAAGTQFALERNDLKNGVFTYSILEAMYKYPTLKISELKKIVGERVEQLTKGLQKPTSRNETIAVDWNVW
ncbi:MAG: caspase family protein [Chitinophagaceae bacterium]|nr:caspase family protein [Chitinophagaceae bacterium]